MSKLRQMLSAAVYHPLHPCYVKPAVALLRLASLLPAQRAPSDEIRRVLIIQPHNSLGDLVLSFPFLDQVHHEWPDAEIDLIVGRAMTGLFEGIPFIRKVIGFTPSSAKPPFARYFDVLRFLRLSRSVAKSNYDLALDPRWDSDGYAFLARSFAFLSGAYRRASYAGCVDRGDLSLDQFMTDLAVGGHNEHELVRKLRLIQRAGLNGCTVEDSAVLQTSPALTGLAEIGTRTADSLLLSAGIHQGERYAVLAPSASAKKRIWPLESLNKVVQVLHAKFGLSFLILGSAREVELCDWVARMNPGIATSLAGKTTVNEMCAILSRAALLLGNDSGPAHVSGMLGTNTVTVSLFPSSSNGLDHVNSAKRFRPCGPRVRVIQPERTLAPCNPVCNQKDAHCITQVAAEVVIAACIELLAMETSGGRPDKVRQGDLSDS